MNARGLQLLLLTGARAIFKLYFSLCLVWQEMFLLFTIILIHLWFLESHLIWEFEQNSWSACARQLVPVLWPQSSAVVLLSPSFFPFISLLAFLVWAGQGWSQGCGGHPVPCSGLLCRELAPLLPPTSRVWQRFDTGPNLLHTLLSSKCSSVLVHHPNLYLPFLLFFRSFRKYHSSAVVYQNEK